jgi:hypothetical protein
MPRSFQIVENKIAEAEFFLKKIKKARLNFISARYYFSAFLSAARSITFALQCSMKDIKGFDDWYKIEQNRLNKDKISRYMLNARNESQKEGIYHLGRGESYRNKNGKRIIKYYFDEILPAAKDKLESVPSEDVVLACEKNFIQLLEVIYGCFLKFGSSIDPAQYYTFENLKKTEKSIEDIEEELGFPRGWTDAIPNGERLRALKSHIIDTEIDFFFVKYLRKDRFGNTYARRMLRKKTKECL